MQSFSNPAKSEIGASKSVRSEVALFLYDMWYGFNRQLLRKI
jgi:hypothetical protein